MKFGEALDALQQDLWVTHPDLPGRHLYLEDSLSGIIPDGFFKGERRDYVASICLLTKDGRHLPGWTPNQFDMFRKDWEIHPYSNELL